MSKIRMPIDTKSLYLNIKNDNRSGHTATVATPIKQGNTYRADLGEIFKINEAKIDFENKPNLIHELIKNSKSKIKIKDVFAFKNIAVNGYTINTNKQFCIYVKEEIDPERAQYGRLKLHYPVSLKYSDVDCDIDNKEIMKLISNHLNNYAFIVKDFTFDTSNSTLNFNALIVGEKDVPYSKVFINEKGAGNKFNKIFNEVADNYDMEILTLREKYGDDVNTENYDSYVKDLEKKAIDIVCEEIGKNGGTDIENVVVEYPYSLFTLRYVYKNRIKYAIIRWTTTRIKYFNLTIKQNAFLNNFKEDVELYLLTEILDQKFKIKKYTADDMFNMQKNIVSIMFTDEGGQV